MLKSVLLSFTALVASGYLYAQTGQLTVKITGAEQDKGKVFIALSPNEDNYKDNDNAFIEAQADVVDGNSSYTFKNLKNGFYAVKVFHDENENGELDTNFIGIPKEPVGFSNNPKLRGMPSFDKVRIEVQGNKNIVVKLQ